jgi:hypothetical protein
MKKKEKIRKLKKKKFEKKKEKREKLAKKKKKRRKITINYSCNSVFCVWGKQ